MTDTAGKIWIAVFTVFYPLICAPFAIAIFYGVAWCLAVYVFASPPPPFWLFASAGIVIGGLGAARNAWKLRKPIIELFGQRG